MSRVGKVILLFILAAMPAAHAGSLTVQVSRADREPLADAAVYLIPDQGALRPTPGKYEILQKNKTFIPFVTILPSGSRVTFSNQDGIGHQIYSFSAAKNFQLPLSEHASTGNVLFDTPGLVTLGCNIHDWMAAYVYIVDTPYFTKSDAAGSAHIKDLPDGAYTVHVAHPGMKQETALTRPITVGPDAGAREEFVLELKPVYFWRPAPRTDGESY